MLGTLIGAAFVQIDADTSPAMKAIKSLGSVGAGVLSTAFLPATAAVAAGVGAMAASMAAAGAAAGAFKLAVGPQLEKVTEAGQKLEAAEEAQEKASLSKAQAQKLATALGVKYGQQIKITAGMSAEARSKAEEYNRALGATTTATEAARKSQAIYDEKMAAMTPATRQTATAFQALKDDIEKWSDSLSGTTMPIFTDGINKLREMLPKLTPFVRIAATEIRQFTSSFGEGQAGRVFKEFGANLQGNAGSALGGFLTSIKNITVGVVGLLNAFTPMQSGVSGGLSDLTQKFADFGAGLGENSGFQTFLSRAQESGPVLTDTLGQLARAFADVASAAGPLSGVGLTVLRIFAELVAAIPTPVLELLVPAIIAVNLGLRAYALYQAGAAAVNWLFFTSVTASNGAIASSRIALYQFKIAQAASALWTGITTAATWAQTAATWALSAAMAVLTSPIFLIIAAVALLVGGFILAYKKSETFKAIVDGAINGVKVAAQAVGQWFAGPFVNFFKAAWDLIYTWYIKPIVWYWTVAVPNAAKFLWGLVVRYFTLMWSGVQFVWGMWQRVFLRPFLWFYTQAIPGAARFLWGKVVGFFNLLVRGVSAGYTAIRTRVFVPIGTFFTRTIPGWASSLASRVSGAWGVLRDGLTGVYSSIRARVFSPIGAFFTRTIPGWARTLRDRVKGYFTEMRDGIGTIWAGIRSKTKAPVNWVLDKVWNKGLVSIWGKIAGWVGLDNKLKTVKLLEAGGTVGPRRAMGAFSRPTAIVGEGNTSRPEFVIPTDPRYGARARALWQAAGQHLGVPMMEDGGILGSIGGAIKSAAGKAVDFGKGALDFMTNPVGKAKELLLAPLKKITGAVGSSQWAKMAARIPRMAVDGLLQAVKSVGTDLLGFGGGGGSVDIGGSGVQRWAGVVRQALGLVGQPANLVQTTLRRMNQESGGNPTVVNKWDSNWLAGYPSVGLMQVIRPTFQSHAGRFAKTGPFMYGVSVNPLANVYASMRYAMSAYGSLPRAYNRAGGYALGTGGATSGWHWTGEHGPELMKLPAGTKIRSHRASVRQAATAGGGSVVHLTVENRGVIGSRQEVEDWLVASLDQLDRRNRLPRSMRGA